MIKEYIVNITRTDYGFIKISGKNKKEAEIKALTLEEQGEVTWNKTTIKIINIFDNKYSVNNKKSKT